MVEIRTAPAPSSTEAPVGSPRNASSHQAPNRKITPRLGHERFEAGHFPHSSTRAASLLPRSGFIQTTITEPREAPDNRGRLGRASAIDYLFSDASRTTDQPGSGGPVVQAP
jgi:hypothetical protein